MKLDRNTNRGGLGKYALVNMRKMIPLLDDFENPNAGLNESELELVVAFQRLLTKGIISLGNETPGDQFFVMKYKDRFTAEGLEAYAKSVRRHAEMVNSDSLQEYASAIFHEAVKAKQLGNHIPD